MKVLIIGGTGILSTDIVNEFINCNNEVYIINRGLRTEFINKNAKLIKGNIRNVEEIKGKVKGLYFDCVIDFLSYNTNDLAKTLSIFNGKCNQFIFISSATVYEKEEDMEIITENTKTSGAKWEYALDKLNCERLLEKNFKNNKQKYTIIRPYVTYGNTRIPFAIIPQGKQWTLAYRILNNKPIVLWDGGKAICTLTHTTDFARGVVGLCGNERAFQNIYNITSEERLTWKEVLNKISEALDKKPVIADIPSSYITTLLPKWKGVLEGDKATNMIFDNRKVKADVSGFECNIKFEDGIKKTIDFYKKNLFMQKIDYRWDGEMDYLIDKYYSKEKNKFNINCVQNYPKENKNTTDRINYCIGRYKILRQVSCIAHKVSGRIKR